MKKVVAPFLLFSLVASASSAVLANDDGVGPAVEVVPPAHFAKPQGPRPFPGAGKIIDEYIREQTQAGLLDSTEYDRLKTQQRALREQIKALRGTGDEAALRAKMDEARTLQQTQRRLVRDLVDNDADLRARLEDHRAEVRDHRRDHRDERRDLQRERLRQRDPSADESQA